MVLAFGGTMRMVAVPELFLVSPASSSSTSSSLHRPHSNSALRTTVDGDINVMYACSGKWWCEIARFSHEGLHWAARLPSHGVDFAPAGADAGVLSPVIGCRMKVMQGKNDNSRRVWGTRAFYMLEDATAGH